MAPIAGSIFFLGCFASIASIALSALTPDPSVNRGYLDGSPALDPRNHFGRALSIFSNEKRQTELEDSASLERSWNDATLFAMEFEGNNDTVESKASVEVTCVTCYLRGTATARLSINGDFDALQAVTNLTDQIGDQVENITDTVGDWVKESIGGVWDDLADGLDSSDFDLEPLDLDFNLRYPDIPECDLEFRFDGLELYLELGTTLSGEAEYTLPLYATNTPTGLSLGDSDNFVGVIFAVDLILSASAELDFTSGIHIKIEDGVAINMGLFSNDIASITYNGGQFEFLPITVTGASGELKAVLRLGIYAGVAVERSFLSLGKRAGAGLQAGVFADIATFTTNFTADPSGGSEEGEDGDDDECVFKVEQSYEFGLGAEAGASVAIGSYTWGPTPETQTPIFYTTIADLCATRGSTADTPTATPTQPFAVRARADGDDGEMTTTTLTKEVPYTGMVCQSPGLINCPASLQKTTKTTATKTLVTVIPSGASVDFPATTDSVVASPVPFGTNIKSVLATTGSPASYVPPPPPPPSSSTGADGPTSSDEPPLDTTGGVDNRIIIGVSVGVGVPVLTAIAAALIFFAKRRRYEAAPTSEPTFMGSPAAYQVESSGHQGPKNAVVTNVRGGE